MTLHGFSSLFHVLVLLRSSLNGDWRYYACDWPPQRDCQPLGNLRCDSPPLTPPLWVLLLCKQPNIICDWTILGLYCGWLRYLRTCKEIDNLTIATAIAVCSQVSVSVALAPWLPSPDHSLWGVIVLFIFVTLLVSHPCHAPSSPSLWCSLFIILRNALSLYTSSSYQFLTARKYHPSRSRSYDAPAILLGGMIQL